MNNILFGSGKGVVIGLVVGVLFAVLDTGHHMFGTKLFLFAVTGVLTGILCGTPIWRREALTSNVIKAGVGLIVGLLLMTALYYLLDFELGTRRLSSHYALVSPILGALYGAFVEFDDKSM
ncbi:hypothetical protein ACFL27_16985 [candidate division CSSED10-310 bacterium]|uniref:TIGR04086 family membrane protein n=1 Tax=candidate division CSSED10-310 bacterium TaxID=2855610 RepID=A0ABV6Z0B4_UNCC1